MGGGGEGTPYNGLYGESPPERNSSFRLQVYERVGISLVEVCKRVGRVGKPVIMVCKKVQNGYQMNFIALKSRKHVLVL